MSKHEYQGSPASPQPPNQQSLLSLHDLLQKLTEKLTQTLKTEKTYRDRLAQSLEEAKSFKDKIPEFIAKRKLLIIEIADISAKLKLQEAYDE